MPSDEMVALATFLCWGTIYGYKEVAQRAKQRCERKNLQLALTQAHSCGNVLSSWRNLMTHHHNRREAATKGGLQGAAQSDETGSSAHGVYGEVFRRREPDAPGLSGLAGLVAPAADDSAALLFQRNAGGPTLGLKELASARRTLENGLSCVTSNTQLALGLLGVMYGCTQRTTRGRPDACGQPSSSGRGGGGSDGGSEAAVWGPGHVLPRHQRGGSMGLGLGALALSRWGGEGSSCATLDTLARCSSSAASSAASTGDGSSASGPTPGMEPCAGSVAGGSCSGQDDREEDEEEAVREATAQERQLAELRGLASSLFALMTTNLVFCSRDAGAEEEEEQENGEDDEGGEDLQAGAGYRSYGVRSESVYSLSPSSAAAGACSSATSPGAACSPWAAAAAGAATAASCPTAPRGFDRLRVRSNMSFAQTGGGAAQDAGSGSGSEDGDGEGDEGSDAAHAGAGSWGCTDGQARVGRRGSGRCEGVYLPSWSSSSLSRLAAAAAVSPVAAVDEEEQLEASAAAAWPSEPQSLEQAGPGAGAGSGSRSGPQLVLLPVLEALLPVAESPQELDEDQAQEPGHQDLGEGQHQPWETAGLVETTEQHQPVPDAGTDPVSAAVAACPISPLPVAPCLAATEEMSATSAARVGQDEISTCGQAPLVHAGASSLFAACCQQQAVSEAAEPCACTTGAASTSAASAAVCEPQADGASTAVGSPAATAASTDPSLPGVGSAFTARTGKATRQLQSPMSTSGRSRASGSGSAVTPLAGVSPTTPLRSSRSARTLRCPGPAAAEAGGAPALACSLPSPGPSPLMSPTGHHHTPSKPSPAAARPAAAAPGSSSVVAPCSHSQLRRQSSNGSSCSSYPCSSYTCSSISAAGITPRSQRQAASAAAVAASAEASLTLSRRRQAREQQAAQAAAATPATGSTRSGAGGGQQLPLSPGTSSTPAPAGSPSPGPSPSYLRSTAASAARAAVVMTPRAAAVHYNTATTTRQ